MKKILRSLYYSAVFSFLICSSLPAMDHVLETEQIPHAQNAAMVALQALPYHIPFVEINDRSITCNSEESKLTLEKCGLFKNILDLMHFVEQQASSNNAFAVIPSDSYTIAVPTCLENFQPLTCSPNHPIIFFMSLLALNEETLIEKLSLYSDNDLIKIASIADVVEQNSIWQQTVAILVERFISPDRIAQVLKHASYATEDISSLLDTYAVHQSDLSSCQAITRLQNAITQGKIGFSMPLSTTLTGALVKAMLEKCPTILDTLFQDLQKQSPGRRIELPIDRHNKIVSVHYLNGDEWLINIKKFGLLLLNVKHQQAQKVLSGSFKFLCTRPSINQALAFQKHAHVVHLLQLNPCKILKSFTVPYEILDAALSVKGDYIALKGEQNTSTFERPTYFGLIATGTEESHEYFYESSYNNKQATGLYFDEEDNVYFNVVDKHRECMVLNCFDKAHKTISEIAIGPWRKFWFALFTISPSGQLLVVYKQSNIIIVTIRSGATKTLPKNSLCNDDPKTLVINNDETILAVNYHLYGLLPLDGNGVLTFYNICDGELIGTLPETSSRAAFALNAQGQQMLISSEQRSLFGRYYYHLKAFDLENLFLKRMLESSINPVQASMLIYALHLADRKELSKLLAQSPLLKAHFLLFDEKIQKSLTPPSFLQIFSK